MKQNNSIYLTLANKVCEQFQALDAVEAVVLGGSQTSGSLDQHSDIDVYVYLNNDLPLSAREEIVARLGASKADLNMTFWDVGDEWFDLQSGIEVDMIYWDKNWIEEQLQRVVFSHQACMGYTTCFWQTVVDSKILFDRQGWFGELQKKYDIAYPEALKQAIINKNYSVLRDVIPSYYNQIKKALDRRDLISVNHRLSALFESYFDLLYALNKVKNPGEKKVLPYVLQTCTQKPQNLQQQIEDMLLSAANGDKKLLEQLDLFLDDLDALLVADKMPFATIVA